MFSQYLPHDEAGDSLLTFQQRIQNKLSLLLVKLNQLQLRFLYSPSIPPYPDLATK